MGKQRPLILRWPVLGLDKRNSFEKQAPYSTPDANNVWTDDRTLERERGGSRPGLGKTFAQQISGGSNPIRMLDTVQYVADSVKSKKLVASANGELWRETVADTTMADLAITGTLASDRLLTSAEQAQKLYIGDHGAEVESGTDGVVEGTNGLTFSSATVSDFSAGSTDKNDHVLVVTTAGTGTDAVQTLSCSGTPTGGTFTLSFGGHTTGTIAYNASSATVVAALEALPSIGSGNITATGGALPGTAVVLTFAVDLGDLPQSVISVDDEGLTGGGIDEVQTVTITGTPTGGSFTLSFKGATTGPIAYNASAATVETAFEGLSTVPATEGTCAGGALPGTPVTITFSGTLGSEDQDMVIADGSLLTGGTDPAIAITETTKGAGPELTMVETTAGETGPAATGVYEISAVGTDLTLATSPVAGGATVVSFRVERSIKVYDPDADTFGHHLGTAGLGAVPTNCKIVTLWNGRLACVQMTDQQNVRLSRQDNNKDWDVTQTDRQRAVDFNNEESGLVGEPVTALIPFSNTCLIIGCTTSIYVLRGNPGSGAQLHRLDNEIGVLDRHSWCRAAGGYLVFMSTDGLYMMAPGCGSPPFSISREILPEELLNLDTSTVDVQMAYDTRFRGIHLILYDGSTTAHWFIDIKMRMEGDRFSAAFWPVAYVSDHVPSSLHTRRDYAGDDSWCLFGGKDGYIRNLQIALDEDDGSNAIASYIMFGPFQLGTNNGYTEGKLAMIAAALAEGSGDVTWSVHVGQTAERAVSAAARETGTWTGYTAEGLQYKEHPRARGAFACVKITSAGT